MKKNSDILIIHDSLIRIETRLDDMATTAVRHEENLKEHMRRSVAAEKGIETLKSEIAPLQKDKVRRDFLLKIAATVAAVALFIVSILDIIDRLTKH